VEFHGNPEKEARRAMNGGDSLKIEAVLRRSWGALWADFRHYVQLGLISWAFVVISIVLGAWSRSVEAVFDVALVGPLAVGIFAVVLARLRGRPFDLAHLRRGMEIYPAALVAGLACLLAGLVGLCVLCIGVVAAAAALFIYLPLVADGGDPFKGLRESTEFALAHPVPMLLLALLVLALKIAAALLTCTLGLIVVAPFIYVLVAVVYEEHHVHAPR